MYIDYVQTNKKLYDLMWSSLKVLAVKRNSSIEDEEGKRKFKKMPGMHRCIGCKAWHPVGKMVKVGNNYYGIDCIPRKGREFNMVGKRRHIDVLA